jgi:signal transduction histidine kinase
MPGYVVGIMVLLQLAVFALYFPLYSKLVNTGATSALLGLGSLLSCLFLYVGAIRFAFNPMKGKYSFLLAGVGLGLSAIRWNLLYLWAYPFAFGCIVALVAWWLVRGHQAARPPGTPAAEAQGAN